MNVLGFIMNTLHMFFVFFPFFIFVIPKILLRKSFKYIMLVYLLTPLHWLFLNNTCLLTNLTKSYGNDLSNSQTKTSSNFSEKYLKWFYKPPMDLIGWKWPNEIDLIINVHWIVIFICLWYYAFFINKN